MWEVLLANQDDCKLNKLCTRKSPEIQWHCTSFWDSFLLSSVGFRSTFELSRDPGNDTWIYFGRFFGYDHQSIPFHAISGLSTFDSFNTSVCFVLRGFSVKTGSIWQHRHHCMCSSSEKVAYNSRRDPFVDTVQMTNRDMATLGQDG